MLYICYCHDEDRKTLPSACQQHWRTFVVLYDSNRSAETNLQCMCIVAKGRIACASYLHGVRLEQKVMSNILPGHNACLYHSKFPFFSRRQSCKSLWLEGPGSALSCLNQNYGLRDCFAYCRLDPDELIALENQNHDTEIYTCSIVFSILAVTAVAARVTSRNMKKVAVGFDDALVITALVSTSLRHHSFHGG